MQICTPITDILRAPNGPRDRQLLYGDHITIIESGSTTHRIRDEHGYEGYIATDTLSDHTPATHWVSHRMTHAYETADMKSRDMRSLSFTSRVTALSETEKFIETPLGFVPKQHLSALSDPLPDLTTAAKRLLGTPYLWGGNSAWGIDCSGLIEAALRATGQTVTARDSGDQEATLGQALELGTLPEKNDLLFWKGHVALVADPDTLIHANAHTMSVTYENIEAAVHRIKTQGDGAITAHKRL